MLTKPVIAILFFVLSMNAIAGGPDYLYKVDLQKVKDDKLTVTLFPPEIKEPKATFSFPAIVPGTYAIYDFGRFVSNLKVISKSGKELIIKKTDNNSYEIDNPGDIDFITYEIEDTWDTQIKKDIVFEPAGTNIEEGKNFVFNTHGFFGYFRGYTNADFILEINKPSGFYPSTGLTNVTVGETKDVLKVHDYHNLVDSPIMYCRPDTTTVQVANTKVLISVYSPHQLINASFISKNIEAILNAQKEYLGGKLPVEKYAFIFYLTDKPTLSGSNGALEHSYSSFYVLPEIDSTYLVQTVRDVAAHEFFHIVTPLTIHSEEIGNFDFNNPVMSKHLWLYEGLTEYAAHHVQVKYGLIEIDQFIQEIQGKMHDAQTLYNDTLPFTYMSKHVLTEKYRKQYNNVYEKGALINLCLDIMLRHYSNGKYGTQNLVAQLSSKYGKEKSFKDEELFDEIGRMTYPEIRNFFREYVEGNKKLPFKEVFALAGFSYSENEIRYEISMGGFSLGINPQTNRPVIFDVSQMDDFGKEMGYREGDEIIEFNNSKINIENIRDVIGNFYNTLKIGDKLVVKVIRKKKNGKEKIKTLKAKIKPVKIVYKNHIAVMRDASPRQIITRNSWLGIIGN